ncbi:RNA polymerase sigma factor [Henriciella sp.]|uniref:RNA polymerase sigma factor n=1 Tax=Henriciella sp. TaxID=1968823 RepID=UPI00260D99D2|nr:RNA polymerase sigma factor [Henriciella sp.]
MVPKTFIGAVGTELNQSSGNRSTESSCLRRTFSEAYAQLVRLAHVRIGNRADAEDLVQEAFVAVGRAYGDRSGEELRRLLFTTLRNLTVNYLKSGHVRAHRGAVDVMEEGSAVACGRTVTPERQLMDSQLLGIAEAAIAAMPARRREALRLHRYDGLTYDEIARRLSVSPRTVKREVADAVAEIAGRLAQAEGRDPSPAG